MTNKQIVLYTRVSTGKQAEFGYSLQAQKEVCYGYAQANGYEIIEHFEERGESAKFADRTELKKMLTYITKNKAKVHGVLFWKLDRLHRNVDDWSDIKRKLKKCGVKLMSATETFDDTSHGRFSANVLSAVAQLDNEVRSERAFSGMKKKVELGGVVHKTPLGYLNITIGKQKSVQIDPERGPIIKRLFKEFAQGGMTQTALAKRGNDLGFKTKSGNSLTPAVVGRMLRNKFYIGMLKWDGLEVKGTYKPLVDEKTFYKVQGILEKRQDKRFNTAHKKVNEDFPLRGFVKCNQCHANLLAAHCQGKTKSYAYYWCRHHATPSISSEELETRFKEHLDAIQPDPIYLEILKQNLILLHQEQQKNTHEFISKYRSRIKVLEDERVNLIRMAAGGSITQEQLQSVLDKNNQEITDMKIAISNLGDPDKKMEELLHRGTEVLSNCRTRWEASNNAGKRVFQTILFPKGVVYQNGNVEHLELSKTLEFIGQKKNLQKDSLLVTPRRIELRFPG